MVYQPKIHPHWSNEREHAFRQLVTSEKYPGIVYNGMDITQENWQHAQNRLSDWIQTLPPQTGIIAVTDARARHLLQVCDNLNINVPEEISIIGIDDEDMTRYLSRIALSSVVQGSRQMGYLAAKLLHQTLEGHSTDKQQRILVPPVKIVERRSTDFHSFNDPTVVQAMHYIYYNACKGIYSASTSARAQGVLRKNFKLDFTLGSLLKQLILMSCPNLAQPYFATSAFTCISRVMPCSGSLEICPVMIFSNTF